MQSPKCGCCSISDDLSWSLDLWPLIFTGCTLLKTTLCTKYGGESLSVTTCIILTLYNNHVQIIILFREWPWVLTSDLDKKTSSLMNRQIIRYRATATLRRPHIYSNTMHQKTGGRKPTGTSHNLEKVWRGAPDVCFGNNSSSGMLIILTKTNSWFKIRVCIEFGSPSWTVHTVYFLKTTTMINVCPWALSPDNLENQGCLLPRAKKSKWTIYC